MMIMFVHTMEVYYRLDRCYVFATVFTSLLFLARYNVLLIYVKVGGGGRLESATTLFLLSHSNGYKRYISLPLNADTFTGP